MQSLSPRQQQVLQATVRHYVDTTEPVGSKTLVRRFGLEASAATVRSAMGALEQRGLLTQPHTSAGRIPSQAGYRVYVNELLPTPGAAASQLERELGSLGLQWAALDDLLQHLARRLADLTGLLSLITRPQPPNPLLQAVRLVASGDRLLVLLVQGQAGHSSLNLRLPAASSAQVEMLERWANTQLQLRGDGRIAWAQLPLELHSSGELLRHAL
ncbi:MAG: HrcA family transcriptional regulator, partial [Cyanobacteria bacterium K_Offshore_0m_m2_072]|nr:HrcA family transcriptional regulator [Cyanobacteria bacterium K_Offshore_0m_m2_072]